MATIKVKITRQENADYFSKSINDVVEVELEDYVSAVVASEVGNASIEEAKAQAIAARTFAHPYYSKGNTITDSSSTHQAYRAKRNDKKTYPNAVQAAHDTAGQLLTYNGNVITTCVYSSSNGGRTVSSKERWGGERAWLQAKDDPWDLAESKGVKNGHGVGMSQLGARYAARIGKTCEEILAFYYTGTSIYKPDVQQSSSEKVDVETPVDKKDVAGMIDAIKLIEKCKIPLNDGWGYIWGTYGQLWTAKSVITSRAPENCKKNAQLYGHKWIGKKVCDCSGLLYWAFKELGGYMYHGSNTIFNKYCVSTGKIIVGTKIKPGYAVFLNKNGSRHHVGIYIGNNKVIESRGTYYGVILSNVSEWDEWGEMKGVDYSTVSLEAVVATYPTIKKGSRGEYVKILQEKLTNLGYLNDKIDGIFGVKTEASLKEYQQANGLNADGVCGTGTWDKLRESIDNSDKPVESDIEDTTETSVKEESKPENDNTFKITVTGGSVYVRTAPNTIAGKAVKVVHRGDVLTSVGVDKTTGWYKLDDGNYISGKYAKIVNQ